MQVQDFYKRRNGTAPVFTVTEDLQAVADQRYTCTCTLSEVTMPVGGAAVSDTLSSCFPQQTFQDVARSKKLCCDGAAKLALSFLRSQSCFIKSVSGSKPKSSFTTPATLLDAVTVALSTEVGKHSIPGCPRLALCWSLYCQHASGHTCCYLVLSRPEQALSNRQALGLHHVRMQHAE